MALEFDANLTAKFTKVTFTGDFSVTLPTVNIDNYTEHQVLIGTDSTRGYIYVSSGTQRLFYTVENASSFGTATIMATGVDHTGIKLTRVGSTLTLDSGYDTESITYTDPISFNIYGGRDDTPTSPEMDGVMSGAGTLSGTGVTTIAHDFDTSTGTTLTDTTGTNDATLQNVVSGGFFTPVVEHPVAIVAQPSNNKVIPRAGETGGIYGKGQGSYLFNATGAGVLEYRIVDEDEITEVVTWASFTTGVDFTVTVPANTQWYKLELRSSEDLADTTLSNRFTCGGVTLVSGQSLAVRMFKSLNDTTDISALGITPSPYQMTCASYGDSTSKYPETWESVTDDGAIDSAFAADFLNRKITQEGVSWALAGRTAGGASITHFGDGEINSDYLFEVIEEVGGFHEFIWFQGHTDSRDSSYAVYKPLLEDLYSRVAAANGLATFDYYSLSIPNINTDFWGSDSDLRGIRRAHKEVCDTNNGLYIGAYDIALAVDGVHQTQQGNLDLSRNIFRAQYGEFIGPSFASFTRSGANINIQFNFKSGGGGLVAVGDPVGIISVSTVAAPFTLITPTSITVNSTDIDIVTPTDLGTDDLLIWFGSETNNDGSTSIRDNYTADGFTVGRIINGTLFYVDGEFIYNEDLLSSLINLSITGITDGLHRIVIVDNSTTPATVIHDDDVSFTSEAGAIPTIPLTVGVRWFGLWFGDNAPTDGDGITGVTV
jgi:hypothetical protein